MAESEWLPSSRCVGEKGRKKNMQRKKRGKERKKIKIKPRKRKEENENEIKRYRKEAKDKMTRNEREKK